MTAPSRRVLSAACETLAAADPALARAYDELGTPEWRVGEP
ncbi:MAG TPA: DNA-3-methyladenine glycosylase 2 family protein, partial [Hyphomonas sp.]|nr:DNA-3-methyladenine glycosylase 2 family protein [Hyphomonas sp.]